jgi:hypothetical protein
MDLNEHVDQVLQREAVARIKAAEEAAERAQQALRDEAELAAAQASLISAAVQFFDLLAKLKIRPMLLVESDTGYTVPVWPIIDVRQETYEYYESSGAAEFRRTGVRVIEPGVAIDKDGALYAFSGDGDRLTRHPETPPTLSDLHGAKDRLFARAGELAVLSRYGPPGP